MSFADIQTVSGDYVQGSFTLLHQSGERAASALFFARHIDTHAREGETKLALRYFRAAVSEFRSIFDLLPADLKAEGLSQQWNRSKFKTQLETHPLIAVLIKVRNFAVHSDRVQGFEREFNVTRFRRRAGEARSDSQHLQRSVGSPSTWARVE